MSCLSPLVVLLLSLCLSVDPPGEATWMDSAGLVHQRLTIPSLRGRIRLEIVRRWTIFEEKEDGQIVIHEAPFLERHPFIYYVDADMSGTYEREEMFLDKEADGINCNEELLGY